MIEMTVRFLMDLDSADAEEWLDDLMYATNDIEPRDWYIVDVEEV